MKTSFLVAASMACCALCNANEKHYSVESSHDIEFAIKALKRQIAPLLITVLIEAGMSDPDATAFSEKWQSRSGRLVEGGDAQIEWDLKLANEILSDLPIDIRKQYLVLSYQWVGPSAILRDEVAACLKISQRQKEQIQNIYIDFYERLAPKNRSDFSYSMNSTEKKSYIVVTQNLCLYRDKKMLDILNATQKAAWNKLLGSPSDALKQYRQYCEKYN